MNIPSLPIRIFLIALLWLGSFCGLVVPVKALNIVPTYDSSIMSDPNFPEEQTAISAAIQVFQTNFSDNFTVYITFYSTNVGLAESYAYYVPVDYQAYVSALTANASSHNDHLALSQLPTIDSDPVTGQNQISITEVLADRLGLASPTSDIQSIWLNTSIMSFTRPPPNSKNLYDMQSAVEHEIDEIMGGGGAGCNLDSTLTGIGATDLFRYATNSGNSTISRSWTTSNGDNAFFSVDGTNLWARFNTDPSGDLGDFWGVQQDQNTGALEYWSPPGVTPHPEVQDAIGTPGAFSYPENNGGISLNTAPDLGTNELTMMDVIGWTLIVHTPPPLLNVAIKGSQKLVISWPSSYAGFILQERTNLLSGAWIASVTGTNNPAVVTNNVAHRYYRVYQAAAPAVAAAIPAARQTAPATTRVLRVLKWQP